MGVWLVTEKQFEEEITRINDSIKRFMKDLLILLVLKVKAILFLQKNRLLK